MTVPALDGVHHLKLPVSDLERSRAWYESRLGYRTEIDFVEDGELRGVGMHHPDGGPRFSLRLDPERAAASAGFDYFSIGVATEAAMRELAASLTALGEEHAGVHWASVGWVLPMLHDPDGHEVRFYTTEEHSTAPEDGVVRDPRERSEQRERGVSPSSG